MKRSLLLLLLLLSNLGCLVAQRIQIDKAQYHAVYDLDLLCPVQVEWNVCAADLGPVKRKASWRFRNDIAHPDAVATHDDFTKSGYQRGHLCPAADRSCSLVDMKQTFSMSNVAPQWPSLNTGVWKATEIAVRSSVLLGDTISVVTIPVFLHRDTLRIGAHGLAVPHAFFKAAWKTGTDSIIGSWFFFNGK